MEEREVRKMERMSKRELIGIAEALTRGIIREQAANRITRIALKKATERAESAEAERDQYRNALDRGMRALLWQRRRNSPRFSYGVQPIGRQGREHGRHTAKVRARRAGLRMKAHRAARG